VSPSEISEGSQENSAPNHLDAPRTATLDYTQLVSTCDAPYAIYALGVVLYQLLVGDFSRAVTTDWAMQITDRLLREDLEKCFVGDPQERFAGAGQLAEQLRRLEERRAASEKLPIADKDEQTRSLAFSSRRTSSIVKRSDPATKSLQYRVHRFLYGAMTSRYFVGIPPFRRTANVYSVDWPPPSSEVGSGRRRVVANPMAPIEPDSHGPLRVDTRRPPSPLFRPRNDSPSENRDRRVVDTRARWQCSRNSSNRR
jgi:hypothetical protein